MRIDSHRIGFSEPAKIGRRIRNCGGKRSVRTVDVEPQIVFAADLSNVRQRIDRTGADRSGRADDEKRSMTAGAIRLDASQKIVRLHSLMLIDRDPPNRMGPEAEE